MLPWPPVRSPSDTIAAPMFPRELTWANVAALRMDQQVGRPVLVEFWDFCRVNSLRTLPYLRAWHERYADAGLRVIGVHTSGFPPSQDEDEVLAAVERLGIEYPVVIDRELAIWQLYGNLGWPARYLWNERLRLDEYHYGEGAYAETERAIQALLGIEGEPVGPLRPEDEPGAELPAQTEDQPGDYVGPYEAGGAWAVLSGSGEVRVGERRFEVAHPGAHALVEHPHHTVGVLDWEHDDSVTCHAVCFTPGVAP
jgi:thiol-disulfide isomerase/thioredoxin